MNFVSYLALILLVVRIKCQGQLCGDVGKSDTLKLTVALFRHGDRTPLGTYRTDPYQEDYWQKWGGWSSLTQVGMEQHFRFGRWVRQCYGAAINETYIPKEFYLRSSADIDRTILSGLSFMAGLFAPKDYQIWSEDEPLAKLWQPIPVHSVLANQEFLLNPTITCPPYEAGLKQMWATHPDLLQIQTDNQGLIDYIAKNAGLSVPARLYDVQYPIADAVYVEKLKGLKLPNWINSTVQDKMAEWKNLWLIAATGRPDILQLGMGEYIRNLRQLFHDKSKGLVTFNFIAYSAHDSTVAPLLKIFDADWYLGAGIPYTGCVFTELHLDKATKRYYIKAFFRNHTQAIPHPVKIRKCSDPCWLDDFDKALQPFTLENKKSVCYPVEQGGLNRDELIVVCVLATFGGTLLILLVLFLVVIPKMKKMRS